MLTCPIIYNIPLITGSVLLPDPGVIISHAFKASKTYAELSETKYVSLTQILQYQNQLTLPMQSTWRSYSCCS